MKNLFFILLCLFLVSCGTPQQRNSSISVNYEGSNVFRSNGLYCDEETLRNAVEGETRPLRIIFSRPDCPSCRKVHNFIKDRNVKGNILIINGKDAYAQFLMKELEITGVPVMFVLEAEKDDRILVGPMNIAMDLLDLATPSRL